MLFIPFGDYVRLMTHPIITLRQLTKVFVTKIKEPGMKGAIKGFFHPTYKETVAVDHLSLTIHRGEMVGFIGPNGAGKSTTLKMLTGILHPTSGDAHVQGLVPWKQRKQLAFQIGTVFGQRSQLWMHLPPRDSYDLFAAMYRVDPKVYAVRLAHLAKTFQIAEFLDVPVRKLSLGQRMRCELVAALLHRPKILYLDEPTIGLDIIAKKHLREHIRQINKDEGVTVLFTSHDMGDIEDVCQRVVMINHGKIVHDSSIDELKSTILREKQVKVALARSCDYLPPPGVKVQEKTNDFLRLLIDTDIVPMQEFLATLARDVPILDIVVSDPPIEQIIELLYQKHDTHDPNTA